MREAIDTFYKTTKVLQAEAIADRIVYTVTRPRHASISELWIMLTDQSTLLIRATVSSIPIADSAQDSVANVAKGDVQKQALIARAAGPRPARQLRKLPGSAG